MELFRIAQHVYSDDLSGRGAYEYGGRWNEKEHAMLYTSGTRSLAMLETLVHLRRTQPPANRVVIVIYVPDNLIIETFYDRQISEQWQFDQSLTRQIGTAWLMEQRSLLLRIPSVIVKTEFNYLLNPLHAEFSSVKIIDTDPFFFDERLFLTNPR